MVACYSLATYVFCVYIVISKLGVGLGSVVVVFYRCLEYMLASRACVKCLLDVNATFILLFSLSLFMFPMFLLLGRVCFETFSLFNSFILKALKLVYISISKTALFRLKTAQFSVILTYFGCFGSEFPLFCT